MESEVKYRLYKPRTQRTFWLTHPKRRLIKSTPFRDRVYQRILNDTSPDAPKPIMDNCEVSK